MFPFVNSCLALLHVVIVCTLFVPLCCHEKTHFSHWGTITAHLIIPLSLMSLSNTPYFKEVTF